MTVFQLTLKGYKAGTDETDDCIKWVKAKDRKTLDNWLLVTGLSLLVKEIDTNPHSHYTFADGVDVLLQDGGKPKLNEFKTMDELVWDWQATVEAAKKVRVRKRSGPVKQSDKGPRLIVYVSGGNVQGIRSNDPNVNITVLDEDNRKDMEEDSIDANEWDELCKEYNKLPKCVY